MQRRRPSRLLAPILAAAAAVLLLSACTAEGSRRFPDPVDGQAVYDLTDELRPEVEAELEARIDAIEARSGAEIAIYLHHDPDISQDENLGRAQRLMDEWGVGREGFDDGLVILIARDPDPGESRVSLFGGSGFLGAYADEDELRRIIASDFGPPARAGDLETALLATVEAVDGRITSGATTWLQAMRIGNSLVGLVGGPLALLLTAGRSYLSWRRKGDDPQLSDSPSVLMAGPPAGMTPPLATVVTDGRATQHSLNTLLLELASTGRLTFHNLDRVATARSDGKPNPETDPAIEVSQGPPDVGALAAPQAEAWRRLQSLAGAEGRLTRRTLWKVNSQLRPVRRLLDREAVRLGWLERMPGPLIDRMTSAGSTWILLGLLALGAAWILSSSGLAALGAGLVIGGGATIGFGRAMSQRTPAGAYVDAMLRAYRRTLHKTLQQARSMREVVDDPEVHALADTPDKAVVWGIALGLHQEVADLIARGLAAGDEETAAGQAAYYPVWLGSSPSTWTGDAGGGGSDGIVRGTGSVLSSSAIPNLGGMVAALGSIGSTPPSSSSSSGSSGSSSSGGGFSGGSSSGGGGASGSF